MSNKATNSKQPKCQKSEELTLFIGGLASSTTARDLYFYFRKFGNIISCEPQTWKKGSKKCRGFALVHCGDRKTHKKILNKKKHFFKKRVIECKRWFSSKEKLEKYNRELKLRKVFVGGLPLKVTSGDLENFFEEKVGKVDIAYVIKEHNSIKSKGFGYVVFERIEDRNKALETKEFTMGKKNIMVTEYCKKSKENKENEEKENSESGNSTAENSPQKSSIGAEDENEVKEVEIEEKKKVKEREYSLFGGFRSRVLFQKLRGFN